MIETGIEGFCVWDLTAVECSVFARRAYCVGGSPKMMCVRPYVRVYDAPSKMIRF